MTGLAQGQAPASAGEILKKILASRTFERSERARALLSYLVREEQAGNGDRLKGFAIAADVFGKDASFDSATDPLVRVQMGRLRDLLETYNTTEGAADSLRIMLRRGSYCPTYEAPADNAPPVSDLGSRLAREIAVGRSPAGAAAREAGAGNLEAFGSGRTAEGENSVAPLPANVFLRHIRLYWVAFAVIIGMLAYLVYANREAIDPRLAQDETDASGAPSRGRRGAVTADSLPVLHIFADMKNPALASLASDAAAMSSRFDYIRSIMPADKNQPRPEGTAWTALDYAMEIEQGADGEVTLELVSLRDGRLLLSRKAGAAEQTGEVASFLDYAVTPEGVLHADISQTGQGNALTDCIERVRSYYLNQDENTHARAFDCVSQLVERGARLGIVHAEYAGLFGEGVDNGFTRPAKAGDRREMLETALKAALRGFDLSPQSARAARVVAGIHRRLGETAMATEWLGRAYDLNPADAQVAVAHASGLLSSGKYDEAAVVFEAAKRIEPRHPVWWDYGHAIGLMMSGEHGRAREVALNLARTPGKVEYSLLRMALARLVGDVAEAAAMRSLIDARDPGFFGDTARKLEKSGLPPVVAERIAAATGG